jgi:hypothetical protein
LFNLVICPYITPLDVLFAVGAKFTGHKSFVS